MKTTILVLALCAGCGGSSPNPFVGLPWSGTSSLTAACGGQDATVSGDFSPSFDTLANGTLFFLAGSGCEFEFNTTGDTATLSNGPVTCSSTSDAGVSTSTVTTSFALTLTGTNNSHLTGTLAGTATIGGTDCTFTELGTATR